MRILSTMMDQRPPLSPRWRRVVASPGFTIVELLIVIVVIAILAAITIVAYTGITRQANSAAVVSAVDSVEKQVRIVRAENPNFNIVSVACLGGPGDYPATDIFEENECGVTLIDGTSTRLNSYTYQQSVTDTFTAAYPDFKMPHNFPVSVFSAGGIKRYSRGIVVSSGVNNAIVLGWIAPDSSGCGRGEDQNLEIREVKTWLMPILYDARDGNISLTEAKQRMDQAFGEDSTGGQPLTMELVQQYIVGYESYGVDKGNCRLVID